jgi:hypothetical protein
MSEPTISKVMAGITVSNVLENATGAVSESTAAAERSISSTIMTEDNVSPGCLGGSPV